MKIRDLEATYTSQEIFDAFNGFILSSDTRVFGKLLARCLLFNQVKDIPGDIVECGVFKGTGVFTFLKIKRFLCPNSLKKVIGFDYFNSDRLIDSLKGQDKEAMLTLFKDRNYDHTENHKEVFNDFILNQGFQSHEFELVDGDICETAKSFCEDRPGFRISLLYIDLDIEKPTYEALTHIWDRS